MWKDRLKLAEGDELRHESTKVTGFMGEEDIDQYAVVAASGELKGWVEHRCHTAVKGFRVTHSVLYRDIDGNVLVDDRWTGQ
ncbi:hypothetical protein [Stutzerimonas stutzeri]|uniref:hypothetical protein n=1 Tax=Stutzerimonas stutzeri TaxID=316 RepID=UPI0015E2C4AA|nr:hypothetical protein [Stutzerimonas stutzeri]MBA1278118.1 hypothetical protein [Stutzerimonas stutzeri]